MKLWIDDIRPAPEGYIWCKSVWQAQDTIENYLKELKRKISHHELPADYVIGSDDIIDIDHDAGNYAKEGGDYINLLNWLEFNKYAFPIHIHSMNVVGVENMRRIIRKNGWREV